MARNWFRRSHRIAVIGGFQAGKTVFTTAFLNHIKHHDPNLLKLGKANKTGSLLQIHFDEELKTKSNVSEISRFPYEEYRAQASEKWPRKTMATSRFLCSFFVSNWHWAAGELFVIDIPGERYADIPMAKKDFSQWSEWLLDEVFPSKDNRNQTAGYATMFSQGDMPTAAGILSNYKDTLTRLYKSFRPIVTPSTFLLAEDGTFHGQQIFLHGNYDEALTGLNKQLQFAPLPHSVMKSNPDLYAQFKKAYERYKKILVIPLFDELQGVNELIVLVDITTILAANTAMKNGSRNLLQEIVKALSPGFTPWGNIGSGLVSYMSGGHWGFNGIHKVAVVASKADKVLSADQNILLDLLKSMVADFFDRQKCKISNLEVEYFTAAATRSAKNIANNENQKRGYLEGTKEEAVYETSRLPGKWPGTWSEGDYAFPNVEPRFPDDEQQAPEHIGMEQIFNYLFDFT
ncbi:YcjX family protein [Pirellulales bacterium]|nr:YcjX family protein [Pirellulales bacterium]